MKRFGAWILALGLVVAGSAESSAASATAGQEPANGAVTGAAQSAATGAAQGADNSAELDLTPVPELPCPSFWSVQPNPSVENSLSYVHDSGDLAVSVTYIADQSGSEVSSETFARVAAEQMNCSLPIHSNLIGHAWSFTCDDGEIEAIVYGDDGDLVLLSIAGRNEKTENYLDGFISFLTYQASRR